VVAVRRVGRGGAADRAARWQPRLELRRVTSLYVARAFEGDLSARSRYLGARVRSVPRRCECLANAGWLTDFGRHAVLTPQRQFAALLWSGFGKDWVSAGSRSRVQSARRFKKRTQKRTLSCTARRVGWLRKLQRRRFAAGVPRAVRGRGDVNRTDLTSVLEPCGVSLGLD
jgi:hypothetical protein